MPGGSARKVRNALRKGHGAWRKNDSTGGFYLTEPADLAAPLRKQLAKVKEEAHGAWGMEDSVRTTSTE
jgi:hypothetical protein